MRPSGTLIARAIGCVIVGFVILFSRDDPVTVSMVAVIVGAVIVFLIDLQLIRMDAARQARMSAPPSDERMAGAMRKFGRERRTERHLPADPHDN